jgi:dsRNA-specific ribonuclease
MSIERIYCDFKNLGINEISTILSIKFKNKEIITRAFMCNQFSIELSKLLKESFMDNRALATLGDSVLKMILAEQLFRSNSSATKGSITIEKQQYESDDYLASLPIVNELKGFIMNVNNDSQSKEYYPRFVEALIAAIYISNGYSAAKKFVSRYITYNV